MKKKKFKKRFIFCISAISLILASYFVFFCIYTQNYTMTIYLNGTVDPENVRVEYSSGDILKVTDIRNSSLMGVIDSLEIDFESVGHGDVDVTVYYEDISDTQESDENVGQVKEQKKDESSFHVSVLGSVWCTSLDRCNGLWTVRLLTDSVMTVLIITFIMSFIEKRKNGDFTYSMVALGGMIFFMSITVVLSVINIFISYEYREFTNVKLLLLSVISISDYFILITLIPLILFCILLSASNVWLVRHEGFSVYNLLGIMLGILVTGGIASLYFLNVNILSSESVSQELLLFTISSAVSFTFCYMECLLASTVFCALLTTRYKIKQPMDYIIILGCAIRKDGSPTPILRERIDRALSFEKEQHKRLNRHALFVTSGGQGSDEVISEAESMKHYLMEHGVPENSILKEDKSVNTYQNMAFSKKVIENDAGTLSNKGIAFSTTNYHVFRGYTLAKHLGMKVKGLSAKTKLYFFPNAFLREFAGLIAEQKKRHAVFIMLGILLFASLYLTARF